MMKNSDIIEVPPHTPVDWKMNGLVSTGELTLNQWIVCGEFIKNINKSVHFWIGDWLLIGAGKWDDMYEKAQEATGLDEKTLRNDKWVAGSIALSRRRDTLSFSHHEAVASCTPEQQDLLLDLAETQGWPVKRLREEKQTLLTQAVQPVAPVQPAPRLVFGEVPPARPAATSRKPDPVAQPYKLLEVPQPASPPLQEERTHAAFERPKEQRATETIDADYQRYLVDLGVLYNSAFSLTELDTACQRVMRYHTNGGLATMRRLISCDKAMVREFVRELGLLLEQDGA